jgi:hypothetical protein
MSDSSPDGPIAALAIFGIFVMPVLGFIVVRYLAHRERMEMIRNGMAPVGRMRGRDWRNAGMPGPGLGMPPPQATVRSGKSCEPDFSAAGQRIVLQKGIRLTFIGLALTIGLSFIGYSDGPIGPMWHPGPWLLGGLIPLCIGLAQVVSAWLSGAIPLPYPQQAPPGPPPFVDPPFAPPPSYGVPPTYDASYTYRPGDTQELRPPPAPPERR